MNSSWKGQDLFGSGPHRFALSRRGFLLAPDAGSFDPTPRLVEYGALEWDVLVTGRLVAATDTALWVLRDAIQTVLDGRGLGTLVDQQGRSFLNMFFARIEWGDRTDRGRRVSVEYVARFHRFTGT
jgi:hypothetical protein